MVAADLVDRVAVSRVTVVIGESDTGKTTLVRDLANELATRGSVGIVDADLGQSEIGPPTTIGLGRVTKRLSRIADAEAVALRFVGITSGARDPRGTVDATRRLVDRARTAGFDRVLVDTCGLVSGDFGRRLKQGMIAAIDPDVVIAVERAAECDAIVRPYAAAARPTVVRLSAAAPARGRTPEMRRAHRERALAMYLSGARSIRLDLSRIPIRRPRLFSGTPIPTTELGDAARVIGKTLVWAERHADVATVISREALDESEARTVARALGARRLDHHAVGDLEGMLAGMEDRNEEMISLGVVEKIDFGRAILRVTTPARPDGIVTIAIGRERYTSANTPAADASM